MDLWKYQLKSIIESVKIIQHKLLKTAIVLLLLGLFLTTSFAIAKPAQATTWYVKHAPYFVIRKVKLTKTVTFHKVKVKKLVINETYASSKTLKKGSIIKVRRGGATWSWVVTGHGMRNTSRYFWVIMRSSSNWFITKVNKK